MLKITVKRTVELVLVAAAMPALLMFGWSSLTLLAAILGSDTPTIMPSAEVALLSGVVFVAALVAAYLVEVQLWPAKKAASVLARRPVQIVLVVGALVGIVAAIALMAVSVSIP